MSSYTRRPPRGPLTAIWEWYRDRRRWPIVTAGGRVGGITDQLRFKLVLAAIAGAVLVGGWQLVAWMAGTVPVMTRDTGPRVVGIPSDSEMVEQEQVRWRVLLAGPVVGREEQIHEGSHPPGGTSRGEARSKGTVMVSNTQQAADRAIQDQDRREADHERHGLAAYDTPAAIEKARQPDNHDHCEMPPSPAALSAGAEQPGELDDDGMPKAGKPAMFGNVRPATTTEEAEIRKTVEALADQFGLPDLRDIVNTKPPEGMGARPEEAAPLPVFTTWDGNTVHYGSVICPNTAPDSQWIAGADDDEEFTDCIWIQHLHTDARMRLSREACGKSWAIAVHRASAAPVVDPVDVATTTQLELSTLLAHKDANVRSSAQRVVDLTNRLLRCCAR